MGRLRQFSPPVEKTIAERFEQGETLAALAFEFGVTSGTVRQIARRNGVGPEARQTVWTADRVAEACKLYRDGWTVHALARKYRTRTGNVTQALVAAGQELARGRHGHPGLATPEARAQLCQAYEDGATIKALATQLDASWPTVREALVACGVKIRGRGGYREDTPEMVDAIVALRRDGVFIADIAKTQGVGAEVVRRVLRENGFDPKRRERRGSEHGSWRGGLANHRDNYIAVRVEDHERHLVTNPNVQRTLEHRLVMARAIGRALEPHETVHHINGDRADNRLDNLQLRSGRHGKGVVHQCMDCGSHNIEDVPL